MRRPTRWIVIDAARCPEAPASLWPGTRFLERVRSLGGPVFLTGAGEMSLPGGVVRLQDLARLPGRDGDIVILVEADQVHLDPKVALPFLTEFGKLGRDYGTQYEHARLPVGIGVRAARREVLLAAGGPVVSEAFQTLAATADSVFHDPRSHCTHEESLLDSRGADAAAIAGQGLKDFLAGAKAATHRYVPTDADRAAATCDARGMGTRFGFESKACSEFPTYVMFDMTNVCNAKCTHCPHGIPEMRDQMLGNATRLDADLFRAVIDECVGRELDFVRITADGEPLLHKELFDLIRYAKERKVGPIGLTTNASLLDERRAEQLLIAAPRSFRISRKRWMLP